MNRCITKEAAVKHISSLINADRIFTAGDGKLDRNMLLTADKGFVPEHGELLRHLNREEKQKIEIVGKGVRAADMILDKIINI